MSTDHRGPHFDNHRSSRWHAPVPLLCCTNFRTLLQARWASSISSSSFSTGSSLHSISFAISSIVNDPPVGLVARVNKDNKNNLNWPLPGGVLKTGYNRTEDDVYDISYPPIVSACSLIATLNTCHHASADDPGSSSTHPVCRDEFL